MEIKYVLLEFVCGQTKDWLNESAEVKLDLEKLE
jgi:hypothetical protein